MPNILVAEDNPADVYLIRAALEEYGIDLPLQVAADGREVLQIICQLEGVSETQLKLIILDLNSAPATMASRYCNAFVIRSGSAVFPWSS